MQGYLGPHILLQQPRNLVVNSPTPLFKHVKSKLEENLEDNSMITLSSSRLANLAGV